MKPKTETLALTVTPTLIFLVLNILVLIIPYVEILSLKRRFPDKGLVKKFFFLFSIYRHTHHFLLKCCDYKLVTA
jgi:hypothetical protein